jgi:hypothetical protein
MRRGAAPTEPIIGFVDYYKRKTPLESNCLVAFFKINFLDTLNR